MGRYRKIDVRIWNDEAFRELSDRGKLAFLFILTHPHMTSLGAMRCTIPGLASELGWSEKAFREAFREAFRKPLLKANERASCLLVPNFLKYNGPESPNVVKSWAAQLDMIPECDLKREALQRAKAFAEALPEAFLEALPEAFRKAMPNPEPEPEHEHEQEQEQDTHTLARARERVREDFASFWSAYPRKTGKGIAEKAWVRAGPPLPAVLDALQWQVHSDDWTRDGGRYIPHPATYLNQGRWRDEPSALVPTRTRAKDSIRAYLAQTGGLDGDEAGSVDGVRLLGERIPELPVRP